MGEMRKLGALHQLAYETSKDRAKNGAQGEGEPMNPWERRADALVGDGKETRYLKAKRKVKLSIKGQVVRIIEGREGKRRGGGDKERMTHIKLKNAREWGVKHQIRRPKIVFERKTMTNLVTFSSGAGDRAVQLRSKRLFRSPAKSNHREKPVQGTKAKSLHLFSEAS